MSTETTSTDETESHSTPRTGSTTFITTSGGLLTDELVSKLRQRQCGESAVRPETFALPETEPPEEADLEEEIGDTWNALRERWDELTMDETLFHMDVSDARSKWILKLFQNLGFEPVFQRENLEAGGIEANLSHKGWPDGEIESYGEMGGRTAPILHTIEPGQKLDEKPEGASRGARSPHDTLQEFLNASDEHDWAVVTNGLTLRVLRDYYHTYTRGYVEFDLENLFTNRNYGDFRALYRLCHASRFVEPVIAGKDDNEIETPLEQLYQVALSTGVKVGQDLQQNVVRALETLGNGFLDAETEVALKQGGQDAAEEYYQDLLYVVYRLLFLMFAEQRGMMSQRESLYTEEYSVTKLRERAEQHDGSDRNTDLWEGLKATFRLVGEGEDELGVPGYNGGLFDDEHLEYILDAQCPNEKLLSAVHDLTHIEQEGYQQRISYADLGVEEIGAVYESLLEFTPQLAETVTELEDRTISQDSFYLDDRGMERKETGSFYTDPGLVDELIQSSLHPVIEDRVDEEASTEIQERQLLNITVCDPACGSGAFLIAANNILAQKLAEIRSGLLYPDEQTIRQARRSVVQNCIYGVDLNPMAAELAKVSLWINSAVESKPLNFLDHRIKQGNSLIGATPDLVSSGLPDDAFETSGGRDHHVGTDIRRLVRNESKQVQSELSWYQGTEAEYVSIAEEIDKLEENSIKKINKKERKYTELIESENFLKEKLAHDVWTAAFYWPLDEYEDEIRKSGKSRKEYLMENEDRFPTPKTIEKIRRELPEVPADDDPKKLSDLQHVRRIAEKIAGRESFFHWQLEFPKVFLKEGGFDCILGNPPWDKIEIEEREFFAVSAPEIASADTQSKRRDLIANLEAEDPELFEKYQDLVTQVERRGNFVKNSGRFSLTAKGHLNTYALFSELALDYINPLGRSGIIVPTGITTDYYTQEYFQKIVEDENLISLFDFENKKIFFPDIHSSFKFSLLTLGGENVSVEEFMLAFYLTDIDQLHQKERKFSLSPEEINLLNPNTKNCPTFRSRKDANQTVKIYKDVGVFKNEANEHNPWGIAIKRMFNRSDDSELFYRVDELTIEDDLAEADFCSTDSSKYLPLYESKYIHQFDHRYSTYHDVSEERIHNDNPRIVETHEKDNPSYSQLPKFWVKKSDYQSKWVDDWHLVLRMVTNATNKRTVISTIIPGYPTVNSLNHILDCTAEDSLLLLASLNSFAQDYAARQKLGGENLNQYIIKQLPIPSPDNFQNSYINGEAASDIISRDTLKLVYNSTDLDTFAQDAGYNGGPYSYTSPDGLDREQLRFKIEAMMWKVYGLNQTDFDTVFDSFEQVKSEDVDEYGYYRTREEIKEKFISLR